MNHHMTMSGALLAAERTGQLPAAAWPALRELLLSSSDPQITMFIEPLRRQIEAQRAVVVARQALDAGYAALAAAHEHAALAEAADYLAALADDLAARIRQLEEVLPT